MRTTEELQGFRRKWEMAQAWLDESDASVLEAMFNGTLMAPHRIIDPLRTNRFRPSVAAARRTSIWNGGVDSWYVASGNGVVSTQTGQYPAISWTADDGRTVSYRPDSGLEWNAAAAGNTLYPNGSLKADGKARKSRVDPILPGETLTASVWLKTTGTGQGTFLLAKVAADLTPSVATTQTFSNTAWQRLSLTYTAPSDGSVIGVFPYFTASADTLNLHIGPGQLEEGTTPTQWQAGYGAPEVAITQLNSVSPRHPLVTMNLTIQEL
ncbi:hypothetical protein [Amycolatopsis anabasis]|uniref:hypothetical protein n=1 Tax=Amycolatopsis anabasis TaxID=1840409 RepID=UPI00131AF091|nr:hypothetical protein [Amycolatopsis anabasis]